MTENTTVLLYSGGLDSYCLAALAEPTVLLHVRMGTSYAAAETARLRCPAGLQERLQAVDLNLGRFERSTDLILPGRNAHLVLLAAHWGDGIMMAATAGDRVRDKDEGFQDRMNALLAYLYQPQHWLPAGRQPRLALPVKQWSKRQLVRRYLDAGRPGDQLATDTFSCYHPQGAEPCGNCKPCVRKYIALTANGIDPGFNARPMLAAWRQQVQAGTWDRGDQEAADVLDAWEATA